MNEIKCPIHKVPLAISETTFNAYGMTFQCVIGKCPSCRTTYTNRMIFPSCTTFKIDTNEYTYSEELNRLYQPSDSTHSSKPFSNPKDENIPVKTIQGATADTPSAVKEDLKGDVKPLKELFYDLENNYLDALPVLSGKKQKCPFCRIRISLTTRADCKIQKKDHSYALMDLPMMQCQKCGTIYADRKALTQLGNMDVKVSTVMPQHFSSAQKMMDHILKEKDSFENKNSSRDTNTLYPAENIYFINKIPQNCIHDHETLIKAKCVQLKFDGLKITTSAAYCPKCHSAYLLRNRENELHQKIETFKRESAHSASSEKKNIQYEVYLKKIPFLKAYRPRCPFCHLELRGRSKVLCSIKKQDGTESLVKLSLLQCTKCKGFFGDDAMLSDLKQFGFKIPTVLPKDYTSTTEMMTAIIAKREISDQKSGNTAKAELPGFRENKVPSTSAAPISQSSAAPVSTLQRIPALGSNIAVCPYCKKELTQKIHVKYPSYGPEGHTIMKYALLWNCTHCNTVYADQSQLSDLRRWNENTSFETVSPAQFSSPAKLMSAARLSISAAKLGSDDMPYKVKNTSTENISEGSRIIQVYANKCHCQRCRNKFSVDTMINRTAVVQTIRNETVKINVMFCQGCGQYFVSLAILEHYKNLYGGLLMECRTADDVDADKLNWFHFAPDTILSRCGYSVKNGISEEYRHAVLSYIMDSGKAKKYEIIEKINSFIRVRENQGKYQDACNRWREDIKYVSDYNIDQQKHVYGLRFNL